MFSQMSRDEKDELYWAAIQHYEESDKTHKDEVQLRRKLAILGYNATEIRDILRELQ
jgi:hypothetical protein